MKVQVRIQQALPSLSSITTTYFNDILKEVVKIWSAAGQASSALLL